MGGMKDREKFQPALQKFHAKHVKPVPEGYKYSLEQVFGADGDPTVASAP